MSSASSRKHLQPYCKASSICSAEHSGKRVASCVRSFPPRSPLMRLSSKSSAPLVAIVVEVSEPITPTGEKGRKWTPHSSPPDHRRRASHRSLPRHLREPPARVRLHAIGAATHY